MKGSWIAFALSGIGPCSSMIHEIPTDCFVMTDPTRECGAPVLRARSWLLTKMGLGFLNGWKMH